MGSDNRIGGSAELGTGGRHVRGSDGVSTGVEAGTLKGSGERAPAGS